MSYKNILYLDATYLTVYILQKPKINIYNIYIGKDFLMHFIIVFFISMFPLIELRGAIPYAVAQGLPLVPSYIIAIIGNMLPVPVIFLFARKVLEWGADKPVIGGFFTFCIEKGDKGGKKLQETAGKGLFIALLLLLVFHFRAREHGRELLLQVFLIWTLSLVSSLLCSVLCLQG